MKMWTVVKRVIPAAVIAAALLVPGAPAWSADKAPIPQGYSYWYDFDGSGIVAIRRTGNKYQSAVSWGPGSRMCTTGTIRGTRVKVRTYQEDQGVIEFGTESRREWISGRKWVINRKASNTARLDRARKLPVAERTELRRNLKDCLTHLR